MYFVLTTSILQAEILKGKFELQSSKINYLVTYLIKKADGDSQASKGKGECNSTCEFLIAAPIKSFQSKDSNRDANMLKTTKADKFPLVVARVFTKNEITNGVLIADLEIEFSGVKHLYKNRPFKASLVENILKVDGSFDLLLEDHKVEKPSLLGVDIQNIVPISITAIWKKTQ